MIDVMLICTWMQVVLGCQACGCPFVIGYVVCMTRHVDASMNVKCDFDGLCVMYASVDVMHCFLVFWMIYYGGMMYDESVT